MSRIGKRSIKIPPGLEIKIDESYIIVRGRQGELNQKIHPLVSVEQKNNELLVKVKNPEDKKQKSLWGLFQRLITNMIIGVTQGYEKKLELIGIGYRVQTNDHKLILNLGFSHPVEFILPDKIQAKVEKNIITISGIDKQLVGEIAAQIRRIKKPEPYKGTGIRYFGEIIRKKSGKKAVGTTT